MCSLQSYDLSMFRLPVVLALFVVMPATPAGGNELQFWLEDSLVKVFPDTPSPAARGDFEVLLPRNGHASLQVVLRSSRPLDDLTLELTPLPKIGSGLASEVRRVGFVPVRNKPPKTSDAELSRVPPGEFPDPLFPLAPFSLQPQRTQPFWITLGASPQARPATHRFRVILKQRSRQLARMEFRARIARATVPAVQTLKVTNWFTWGEDRLARQYPALTADPAKRWPFCSS